MLVICSAAVPEFVSVAVSGWLDVAITSSPNVKVAGDKEAAGAPVMPTRDVPPPPQLANSNEHSTANPTLFFIRPSLQIAGAY
jgi:hypothetical protein